MKIATEETTVPPPAFTLAVLLMSFAGPVPDQPDTTPKLAERQIRGTLKDYRPLDGWCVVQTGPRQRKLGLTKNTKVTGIGGFEDIRLVGEEVTVILDAAGANAEEIRFHRGKKW